MNYVYRLIFFLCIVSIRSIGAIDNHHFYRASNFFHSYHEPRFEKSWLSSFDATVGGGSTDESMRGSCRTGSCTKSCLLDICGNTNIQALGYSPVALDANNPVDLALLNLALLPARNDLANLSYWGEFSIIEANFLWTQNLDHGLFFQIHAPVRRLKISDIRFIDLSPHDGIFPDAFAPEWQTFLSLYPTAFSQRFGISLAGQSTSGIGDMSFLLGLTRNFDCTEVFDFIDVTFKLGILAPTGKTAHVNNLFELPVGYNGHIGIPLSFQTSFGLYEWLTLGAHIGVMPFAPKTRFVRTFTDKSQSGVIKLDKFCARVHQGLIYDFTTYLKLDHICCGTSFLLGYTYAHKESNSFKQAFGCCAPTNCQQPFLCPQSCDIINGSWTMQTIHLFLEWDMNQRCETTPRIGLFCNIPVAGRNIFKTTMGGLSAGIDFTWLF